MWCRPSGATRQSRMPLQMHTVVEQPLTDSSVGRVSCTAMGVQPVEYVWHAPHGTAMETNPAGNTAHGVAPGRYRVVATDAEGSRADVTVDVEATFPSAVVIREYRVTNASTGFARDGSVEAVGFGLEDGWRFVWTNGYETDTPVLRDVPCGTYTAFPLPRDGIVPTFVHTSTPARVGVLRQANAETVSKKNM